MVDKLAIARERFGRDFAADSRSTYKPRATRLLTEWTAARLQEKRRAVIRPIDAKRRSA